MTTERKEALALSILLAAGVFLIVYGANTPLIWDVLLYWLVVLMYVLMLKAKRDNG